MNNMKVSITNFIKGLDGLRILLCSKVTVSSKSSSQSKFNSPHTAHPYELLDNANLNHAMQESFEGSLNYDAQQPA